jgi:riboflavin synthase
VIVFHIAALEGNAMFTGIIRHVGTVRTVRRRAQSCALSLEAGPVAAEVVVGDSVCVDGVCLTATKVDSSQVEFDVGAETLRLSTLGALREGDTLNLEPSLRVGDPLGGHFVSGHVDGVGTIRRKDELPGEVRLEVEVSPDLTDQMIMKGSVAVDGISLTIAALASGSFEVSLIPHTIAATTMQHKGPGDRVNIECDTIGRWVRRVVSGKPAEATGSLSIPHLEEQGF